MKLTIAVVTMNRAKQLEEALESCFNCDLPNDTQFVIIDNASTDDTEEKVKSIFRNHNFLYYYEKLDNNIGCGNGRNYAYSKSDGDYVYFLDDDAYIDLSNNKNFFTKAIEILDTNPNIKTLTTQIYDLVWKRNRVDKIGPKFSKGLYKIYMFCGGSHFLKRDFFKDTKPYFANKYGYEEIYPSLNVYNYGYINAFASDLLVIHNPLVNKWDVNSNDGIKLVMTGITQTFIMRSSLFPILLRPLNFLAFFIRILSNRISIVFFKELISLIQNNQIKNEKIISTLKYSTVYSLFKDFKFSIF